MKRRNIILLIGMLIIPFAALIWVVLQASANEQLAIEQRFQQLLLGRLTDVDKNIRLFFEDAARDVEKITAIDTTDIDQLRSLNRNQPRLMQLFVMNPNGVLIYPDPTQSTMTLNARERLFLIEAAKMFTGQDLKEAILRAEQNEGNPPPSRSMKSQQQTNRLGDFQISQQQNSNWQQEAVADAYVKNQNIKERPVFEGSNGWFQWYWDRGINLIYWQRRPNGKIIGGVLERARWMADLIGQLPDTVSSDSEKTVSQTNIRLVDSSGDIVYQWGSYEPASAAAVCNLRVSQPLSSWELQCFAPMEQLTAGTGRSARLTLLTVIAAVGALLCLGGYLFLKDYVRDMREAEQQVSFVNQVSHEFKTPLTNIRMYAELLQRDLSDHFRNDPKSESRVAVIVSEGQRLSRLIGNVLTFARQRRRSITVQPVEVIPDDLIRAIVDRFRPALEQLSIDISLDLTAGDSLWLDTDFVEQILGNLISNVEKYAVQGRLLEIVSHSNPKQLTIDVRDAGDGIPAGQRNQIFLPFQRLSNDVSYAAGTGIGLTIARELAQLHGGDLALIDCPKGCCFRLTMNSMPKEST